MEEQQRSSCKLAARRRSSPKGSPNDFNRSVASLTRRKLTRTRSTEGYVVNPNSPPPRRLFSLQQNKETKSSKHDGENYKKLPPRSSPIGTQLSKVDETVENDSTKTSPDDCSFSNRMSSCTSASPPPFPNQIPKNLQTPIKLPLDGSLIGQETPMSGMTTPPADQTPSDSPFFFTGSSEKSH